MPTNDDFHYRVAAYDPAVHDREDFSCGVAQIDNFISLNAKKQQNADMVRVRVLLREPEARVLGFHVLNAHSLDAGELPEALAKRAPRHGRVPVAYLSMIGIDLSVQGQALGELLLMDTFQQIARAAALIGTAAAVLDITNDGDTAALQKRARYYARFGFKHFPEQPNRMFVPMAILRQIIAR
jgi:hypothetical protein